jgi:hypothetical protein
MNEVASPSSPRVRPFDLDGYAAAMRELLFAPRARLAELGESTRLHARRWDWDAAADAQEHFYLEVMELHQRIRHSTGRI